jgi:cytolysin (calcineurin-like family phosphatase)
MRNVSDKVVKKIKAHILRSITFLCKNYAVDEKMWNNIVQPVMPRMTIWRLRIACWMTNVKHTHLQYVILTAFRPQNWLHEGV